MTDWQRVVFAGDCEECFMCGEPICCECLDHYADCPCPGPTQDDEYEYKTDDGLLYARRIDDDQADS